MAYTSRMKSEPIDPPVARTAGKRPNREEKLTLRVTEEFLAYIDERAEAEGRTRSDFLRIVLRRGLEAQ